jgi:hypothetical protein
LLSKSSVRRRDDVQQDGKEMENAAEQHETMPDCMVVRQPMPGVKSRAERVGLCRTRLAARKLNGTA